jgi:MFS transporter, PHS family, inorganic phosphate transporter
MQGNFIGAIVTLVVLAIWKSSIHGHQDISHLNSAWRVVVGLILVPCLATLYQRLTLKESAKFRNVQALREDPNLLKKGLLPADPSYDDEGNNKNRAAAALAGKKQAFKEFVSGFRMSEAELTMMTVGILL